MSGETHVCTGTIDLLLYCPSVVLELGNDAVSVVKTLSLIPTHCVNSLNDCPSWCIRNILLYKLFQSHSVSRVPRRACPHQNQSLFILVLFLVLYHVSWYIQLKTVDIFPNNCYLLVDYKTCTLS